jgi:enoyl-CoA hydratase/carnithine racemase
MDFETLLYEAKRDYCMITLNRPQRKNAISLELTMELGQAIDNAVDDRNLRFIVLTGAGGVFSSGADFGDPVKAITMIRQELDAASGTSVAIRLIECPKPVIAAVNGHALGHGAELALMCDLIIAAEEAEFGFIGPIRGVTCPYAMIRLADEVGRAKAKELIMTCERISASEALRIGLVNQVVPLKELMSAVDVMLDKMRKAAPLAVKFSKEAINRGLGGYDFSAEKFEEIITSKDAIEGAMAFMEKREPKWSGE